MKASSDARYTSIRSTLEKLSSFQLTKILAAQGQLVTDEHNYDEVTGRY